MTLADATAVVTAVRAVLTAQQAWQGTATELLAAADGTLALPGNARAMAAHLRSVAPLLRKSGIQVSFVRSGHAGTRTIHLVQLSATYAEASPGFFRMSEGATTMHSCPSLLICRSRPRLRSQAPTSIMVSNSASPCYDRRGETTCPGHFS